MGNSLTVLVDELAIGVDAEVDRPLRQHQVVGELGAEGEQSEPPGVFDFVAQALRQVAQLRVEPRCVFRRKRSVSSEFSITRWSEAAERPTRGRFTP